MKGIDSTTTKRPQDLELEKVDLEGRVKDTRKRLKLHASFDTTYWTNTKNLAEKELALNTVKRQISMKSMNVAYEEWESSTAGQRLLVKQESFLMDLRLAQEQLDRKEEFERESGTQKAFADIFIGSPLGWGLANSRGQRDGKLQSAFRADLIQRQNSSHPDPDKELLWCPIVSDFRESTASPAGHLFSWKAGPEAMNAIFGEQDTSELFKAENGIVWSQGAEDRFSAGHFCIVPDIPDDPTTNQMQAWESSAVKEYKIRVLNPDAPMMVKKVGATETKWFELDQKRVEFRSNFRPRARYLYFAYCEAMLKRAYAGKHAEVARAEAKKRYWGTPGRYVLKSMLRGFVNVMGHDYSHILDGGLESVEEDDGKIDVRGTLLANKHIQDSLPEEDEGQSSDNDDDDDDAGGFEG
ncbi:MAG: hypothetical protein Q9196_004785 [Gyalolechia fulgens]